MKPSSLPIIALALILAIPFACNAQDQIQFLKFPAKDIRALGQIDKLTVTVHCSRISELKNIPELYDIEMEYEIPSVNTLEARPRLGAAAVDLSHWDRSIGVYIPSDSDRKSCFSVEVIAEGRGVVDDVKRHWLGQDLGLTK